MILLSESYATLPGIPQDEAIAASGGRVKHPETAALLNWEIDLSNMNCSG
jgi:hypothetical protein